MLKLQLESVTPFRLVLGEEDASDSFTSNLRTESLVCTLVIEDLQVPPDINEGLGNTGAGANNDCVWRLKNTVTNFDGTNASANYTFSRTCSKNGFNETEETTAYNQQANCASLVAIFKNRVFCGQNGYMTPPNCSIYDGAGIQKVKQAMLNDGWTFGNGTIVANRGLIEIGSYDYRQSGNPLIFLANNAAALQQWALTISQAQGYYTNISFQYFNAAVPFTTNASSLPTSGGRQPVRGNFEAIMRGTYAGTTTVENFKVWFYPHYTPAVDRVATDSIICQYIKDAGGDVVSELLNSPNPYEEGHSVVIGAARYIGVKTN